MKETKTTTTKSLILHLHYTFTDIIVTNTYTSEQKYFALSIIHVLVIEIVKSSFTMKIIFATIHVYIQNSNILVAVLKELGLWDST